MSKTSNLGLSDENISKKYEIDTSKEGVLYARLQGPVGAYIRADEIYNTAKIADAIGPGQTLVFHIFTNGGLVSEIIRIADAVAETRKNHRVVMWIEKAISAGAATALCADEIYFQTDTRLGAITTLTGAGAVSDAEQFEDIALLQEQLKVGSRPAKLAYPLKLAGTYMSYDKDEITGEITWYVSDTLHDMNKIGQQMGAEGLIEGFYRLDRPFFDPVDSNGKYWVVDGPSTVHENRQPIFVVKMGDKTPDPNSGEVDVIHSGFGDGVADTKDELAKLLDLPDGWHEVSPTSRKDAENWHNTVKETDETFFNDITLELQMTYPNLSEKDKLKWLISKVPSISRMIKSAPYIYVLGGDDGRPAWVGIISNYYFAPYGLRHRAKQVEDYGDEAISLLKESRIRIQRRLQQLN